MLQERTSLRAHKHMGQFYVRGDHPYVVNTVSSFSPKWKLESVPRSVSHLLRVHHSILLHHVTLGTSNNTARNIHVWSWMNDRPALPHQRGQEPIHSDWTLLCRGLVAAMGHNMGVLTGQPAFTLPHIVKCPHSSWRKLFKTDIRLIHAPCQKSPSGFPWRIGLKSKVSAAWAGFFSISC